ncbi:sugar phosphate isomerase/epimerase family protein [Fundidesulfovibrio agrisoli]|uniref:sugar phosphate isomerase/epimerase family protein n=1 Tax=Fundidesulfovibrio agrisoli TaxID=2922717 RepID=UPI001FAD3B2D|nr:sugar phosphate isomerase/epimerase family protein [Fundidesulfovibrio agrisoli]
MFFVNLTLRAAHRDPQLLEEFLARGVNPELGLDPVLMDRAGEGWHRALAERLEAQGLTPSLHLPFFDLQPGSADSMIRAASRDRLARAMRTASIYRPAHLVGHVKYDHLLYMRTYDQWLERSVETWEAVMDAWPDHPPLYLENTFEPEPWMVARLVEALAGRGRDVGICLDVGHWYSFAGGQGRGNLLEWLEGFAPRLSHLHLHDNDGSTDQHKGLGQGSIPWERVFPWLEARGLEPTVTFEPHTPEAYKASMRYVAEKPAYFERLGVSAPEPRAS